MSGFFGIEIGFDWVCFSGAAGVIHFHNPL